MTTARAIRLGLALRHLRTEHGMTLAELSAETDVDKSTLNRYENAKALPPPAAVRNILIGLGVTDRATLKTWADLAREASTDDPWMVYRGTVPDAHLDYVGLEAEADLIETYEPMLIPGLVQTVAYTRQVMLSSAETYSLEDVEARIAARQKRQERLTGQKAPRLHVVLDENALRRPIGDSIMDEQWRHLAQACAWPQVAVQILPLSAGLHPGHAPLTILTFHDTGQVIAVEDGPIGNRLCHAALELQAYREVWDALVSKALGPAESLAMIEEVARQG